MIFYIQLTSKRQPWYTKPDENGDFQLGGYTKAYADGKLQYYLYKGAGHMVSIDCPSETLKILSEFIEGTNQNLFGSNTNEPTTESYSDKNNLEDV